MLPSATSIVPVSVARSSRCVGSSVRAWRSASARTSRPSASVLLISIVVPSEARTTSPGRVAWPESMFSVAATTANARNGTASSARAPSAVRGRCAAGHVRLHVLERLRRLEREPARVVGDRLADEPEVGRSPWPTAARSGATISRGSSWLPRATERNEPIPAASSSAGPSTVASRVGAVPAISSAAAGEGGRRQLVRRRVHEVAAAVRPAGDDGRAARLLEGGLGVGPDRARAARQGRPAARSGSSARPSAVRARARRRVRGRAPRA